MSRDGPPVVRPRSLSESSVSPPPCAPDHTGGSQPHSTETEGWSFNGVLLKEKAEMQSNYLELLEQKDTEIRQLNQKLEDRLQNLITKQETIDTLLHQPAVSKQHLSCDPQLMTELRDKELRLLETKSQLKDSNKEVKKLRRLLEAAEQELRDRHEACNTEGDMPNSSKTDGDNGRLNVDFSKHRVEIARLKAEAVSAKMEN